MLYTIIHSSTTTTTTRPIIKCKNLYSTCSRDDKATKYLGKRNRYIETQTHTYIHNVSAEPPAILVGVGCIAADPRQQQFQIESIFEEEGVVKEAEQVN